MADEPDVRGVTAVDRLRSDAYLGPVVEEVGELRVEPAPAFFPRFARSIVRQQVSMTAAAAIEDRLTSTIELEPDIVAEVDPAALQAAGLSAQKAGTIVRVAERFADGTWSQEAFEDYSDEEVVAELTDVRGIGVWTAKMQLMFSLGRPDVFPVEDLGIRRGMQAVVGEDLTRGEMVDVAERWEPVRTLASMYLWELED